jgi:outer membrane usher protein
MASYGNQLISASIFSLLLIAEFCGAKQVDDLLPPSPTFSTPGQELVYHLGLVINHYDTQQVIPVVQRNDSWYISSSALLNAGLSTDKLPAGEVNISSLEGVRVEYDGYGHQLLLTVPRDWLPEWETTFQHRPMRVKPLGGHGALFNYDVYTSHQNKISQAALWHGVRLFSGQSVFSSTGLIHQNLHGEPSQHNGYTRYDSTLTWSDDENALDWSLGDTLSDSLSWSSSVRVAGGSLGRNFSLRPDLVTWPLPTFSGDAVVPTAVDLFIDGYKAGSTKLQPGPFTMTNLPYINGAGEAVIVTTDTLGRQVSTTLPFYVTSRMLKTGLTDGAATIGVLRRNYGMESFNYGPMVGSGTYRYGINDYVTFETHAEGAKSLVSVGGGALAKLGLLGIANSSYTHSQMYGNGGQQLNWGYQYNTNSFSLVTQHTYRDKTFGSLALYDSPRLSDSLNDPIASLSQRNEQYSFSLNMGNYGNVGAAWIGVRSFDNQKAELLNLSWSRNLWGGSNIYLAASREQHKGDWAFAVSMQIPLGGSDNLSISTENSPKADSQRLNYSHTMPSDGGLSWNMSLARQPKSERYQQATAGWRNNHVELQGGIYGEKNMMTWWGETMGSVVMMDGQLFTANKINDAFAVVSTDGQPGVPVNYENQPIGKTDSRGYLLVSGVSGWYPALYSIDTLTLPADIQLSETEKRIALRRHSGYLISFPMKQEHAAIAILQDEQGNPLPVSSEVICDERAPVPVGFDGVVWLNNLREINQLTVITPQGKRCTAVLVTQLNTNHQLKTYGPLLCKEGK